MLIQFKVSNYRSIAEEQTLSLIPATSKEYSENIIKHEKFDALNSIALYGPNGGGKSNFLRALGLLDKMINLSGRTSSTTSLPHDPFLLREGWSEKPTFFEIVFEYKDARYRLGVEFNSKEIIKEYLFRKVIGREVPLYEREGENIDVSSAMESNSKLLDAAIEATRPNALFISMCDILNIENAKLIIQWFSKFSVVDGLNTEREGIQTVELWKNEIYRTKIKSFLSSIDLDIVDLDITAKEFNENLLPNNIPSTAKEEIIKNLSGKNIFSVFAHHVLYNKDGKPSEKKIAWEWSEKESSGSLKIFELSGPIIWALLNGNTLVIDEIEAKMHPLLTLNTIGLFLNPKTNLNKAQLIFSTHDTNLLTFSKLRRDQIYFVEKNAWESSMLYSLSDFVYFGERNGKEINEKERPDTDKEKRYLEGRYGAIPTLEPLVKVMQ